MSERHPLLVLGLGNVRLADDGLGVEAVHWLVERYRLPVGVRVVDGGTLGLTLLTELASADQAILVNAVALDEPAGTLVRLEDDDVPSSVDEHLSPHQMSVANLISAAQMIDQFPRHIVLLGLVPELLQVQLGYSSAVRAALPRLVAAIAKECEDLGRPLLKVA